MEKPKRKNTSPSSSSNELDYNTLKQLKEFDKLYNTKNFPALYKATQRLNPKPNIPKPRSRSVSSEGSTTSDTSQAHHNTEFKTPRRAAKQRKLTGTSYIATNNSFSELENAMDMDQTPPNEPKKHKNPDKDKANTQAQGKTKTLPKIRPPPIYAELPTIKHARALLKDNQIPENGFTLKEYDGKRISISLTNMECYDNTLRILKTATVQYYTYTPRHLKIKTLVLKGIRGGYDETDIHAALTNPSIPGVTINKVGKLVFNRNSPNKYHFIVSLAHDSETIPLVKINRLLNQRCTWERLKRPPIFQCRNCQQVGHASSNCNFKPVCPKCSGEHDIKNCPLKDDTDRTKLKCANCGESGHSAAYKGCPMLKMTANLVKQIKQQKRNEKNMTYSKINRTVTPGRSYAIAAAGPTPAPQPRPNTTPPILPPPNNTHYTHYQSHTNNTNHNTNNDSSNNTSNLHNLEELLSNFKNEIIKEIQELNTKVINNSIRIDHIMAQFYSD